MRDKTKETKKGAYWICRCDCGKIKSIQSRALRNGLTQSCGCLNREINSRPKQINDMIGKRFGKLTVVKRQGTHVTPSGQKKVTWLCKCDCGNDTVVTSEDLKSGHTKSCGCLPTKTRGSGLINLVGQRFGKLVVIERSEDATYESNGKTMTSPRWLCKCDCGNNVIVQGGNLRSGNTKNCGCDRRISKGELSITSFLSKNNVKHIREYWYKDLTSRSGKPLRFDFAILNSVNDVIALLEYQGEQHFIDCGAYGRYQREYSDNVKREYCKFNHIPLYEIKYNDDLDQSLHNLLNDIKNK